MLTTNARTLSCKLKVIVITQPLKE